MPTLFLALQCFQCSTMQVKQQKKSGAKWVCAVCNARQSVRRVHAQGPLARDLRHFVQAFNLSRMPPTATAGSSEGREWTSSQSDGIYNEFERVDCSGGINRRTDWSEYLDPKEDGQEVDVEEDDGAKIVTELPGEMFVKSSRKHSTGGQSIARESSKQAYRPKFSKRRQDQTLDGRTDSKKQKKPSETQSPSRRSSEYLEHGEKNRRLGSIGSLELAGYEHIDHRDGEGSLYDDVAVEDEVHPDFR